MPNMIQELLLRIGFLNDFKNISEIKQNLTLYMTMITLFM